MKKVNMYTREIQIESPHKPVCVVLYFVQDDDDPLSTKL